MKEKNIVIFTYDPASLDELKLVDARVKTLKVSGYKESSRILSQMGKLILEFSHETEEQYYQEPTSTEPPLLGGDLNETHS